MESYALELPSNPLVNMDEWRIHIWMEKMKQFKQDGSGCEINRDMLASFPLFPGKAPAGHLYPQAFNVRLKTTYYLWVEEKNGRVLLRRKLPSSRKISIDTRNYQMLNGGKGHLLCLDAIKPDGYEKEGRDVTEAEARKILIDYKE